mgnify:CR=1 FL=1
MQSVLKIAAGAVFLLGLCSSPALAESSPDTCPCSDSINRLKTTYENDKVFRFLLDQAFAHMQEVPEGYRPGGNPWMGKDVEDLYEFLNNWCTFLPTVKDGKDNGLKYIAQMDLFSYKNPFGQAVFQMSPGREIFAQFVRERGQFMDSPASTKQIPTWLKDPRTEKQDYVLPDPDAPDGGFTSYNEFFARSLKNQSQSRPQTLPSRDYVITAPTDALMNTIPMQITDAETPIPTKGTQKLNIQELLAGSKYWERFVGGTALSCILMPNTYHRYHAPVSGKVVEAELVDGALIGMEDFASFAPANGNVGYYGADFSPFENYKRGYFIIDTGKYGYVAVVPVGLSTVGSVVFQDKFLNADQPVEVQRGEELGHFLYGGSLVMLIFEPGRYASGAIKVRLGNQIGAFDPKSGK